MSIEEKNLSNHTHDDSDAWWIARSENTDKVWYGLVSICVLLVIFDFAYHGFFHEKHGYFVFDTAVAFHAMYGFGAFVFVVLLGKELRKVLMRSENYYNIPKVEIQHDDHDEHDHHDDHDQPHDVSHKEHVIEGNDDETGGSHA